MLWFAFKFVPLSHRKQPMKFRPNNRISCDLLSNLYLWATGNSHIQWLWKVDSVVICFQICTFEPQETAKCLSRFILKPLWFAFKFVPLSHRKQQIGSDWHVCGGCDLLSNLYLWATGNSILTLPRWMLTVVICFQICTFEPQETAQTLDGLQARKLWFAFKFVPLSHRKQHLTWEDNPVEVVICFQICTFEPQETARDDASND